MTQSNFCNGKARCPIAVGGKTLHIETFNESPELSKIRQTRLYTKLRPYVHERLAPVKFAVDFRLRDEDESRLSVEDRYFAKLDILIGQVLKNCKTRQFLKMSMARQLEREAMSCLSIEVIDRAYISELVTLFERLNEFPGLLRESFVSRASDVSDLEKKLLSFFNPDLFDKRNFAHHGLYAGFSGLVELELLEEKVVDIKSLHRYCEMFSAQVHERLNWYRYTEESFAPFLFNYLELVDQKIRQDDEFMEPTDLPEDFRISRSLSANIRRQYKHKSFYKAVNSNQ
ncbi:hypothetical protein [Marinobacter changyiensis]|uniref:hypothetical protein n=1 Tax=Marinobacter changyiensis TaxID=2604091 RepID=UPI001265762F|nr:hypothetical protein [Marinobacter changyiensis]